MTENMPTKEEYADHLAEALKDLQKQMPKPVITYMKKGKDQLYFISPKELPLKKTKTAIKKSVDNSWQFLYNTHKQTLKYNSGFEKVMTTMHDDSWGNIVFAAKKLSDYDWIKQNKHAKDVLIKDPEHFYKMEAVLTLLLNFMEKKAIDFKKKHHHLKKHVKYTK